MSKYKVTSSLASPSNGPRAPRLLRGTGEKKKDEKKGYGNMDRLKISYLLLPPREIFSRELMLMTICT